MIGIPQLCPTVHAKPLTVRGTGVKNLRAIRGVDLHKNVTWLKNVLAGQGENHYIVHCSNTVSLAAALSAFLGRFLPKLSGAAICAALFFFNSIRL